MALSGETEGLVISKVREGFRMLKKLCIVAKSCYEKLLSNYLYEQKK